MKRVREVGNWRISLARFARLAILAFGCMGFLRPVEGGTLAITDFDDYSYKSNVGVAGGSLRASLSPTLADDFSQDNIVPNGWRYWTPAGTPTLSGGFSIANANNESLTHAFPSPSYGYVEVDIIPQYIWESDPPGGGSYVTPLAWNSDSHIRFRRVANTVRCWVCVCGIQDGDAGGDFVIAYNTTPKRFRILVEESDVKCYVDGNLIKTVWRSSQITMCQIGAMNSSGSSIDLRFDNVATNIPEPILPYLQSGVWISNTYDWGYNVDWGTMNWNATLNGGTTGVKVQSQAADSGWGDLSGASAAVNGSDISSLASVTDGHRYLRVRIEIEPNAARTATPVFDDFTVAANGPPSFTSAAIAPDPAYATSTLSVVCAGWSDGDGDPESYRYQWKKNGTNIGGATSPTLSAPDFAIGDSITCVVTAWDGTAEGNSIETAAVTILPATATLQVALGPEAAVSAGTRWRVVGIGGWHNSGDIVTLAPGPYMVRFKDVLTPTPGWRTPPNRPATLTLGQATQIAETYSGRIGVTIGPAAAIADGAKWRVVGIGGWRNSGDAASLPLGTYTLRFKDLATPAPGWTTPARQSVTNDQPLSRWGTYQGRIAMTLEPPEAVSAGAKWRVVGIGSWHNTGESQSGLPVGATYPVRFKPVTGWVTPTRQDILVSGPTNGTGTYTAPGALPARGGFLSEEDAPAGVDAARWMLY